MVEKITANDVAAAKRVLKAARLVMKAAGYCFLITVDGEGQPQARLMEPYAPEEDMAVWMATNPKTRKMGEIRRDRRATLAYYDAKGAGYVTMIGEARIAVGEEEKRQRWREDRREFFPGGAEGDDYVLIEFTPLHIEVVSYALNVATDPFAYKPAIVERSGSEWIAKNIED